MVANVSIRKGCRQTRRALQINPFETSLSLQMQNTLKIDKKKGGRLGLGGKNIPLSISILIEVMALFNFKKSMYVSLRLLSV